MWAHVAATYDYDTGLYFIYFSENLDKHFNPLNTGKGYEISTNAEELRMGVRDGDSRYFKGKITRMKVYDVALNEAQIKQVTKQGICK